MTSPRAPHEGDLRVGNTVRLMITAPLPPPYRALCLQGPPFDAPAGARRKGRKGGCSREAAFRRRCGPASLGSGGWLRLLPSRGADADGRRPRGDGICGLHDGHREAVAFEEDGLTVTRACAWSAPGCHPTACGIKYYTDKEGTWSRWRGDENNPITHGTLCVRCLTLKDATYHPQRVLHPLKRDPKDRGKADAWEQITWDEAFDLIESEIPPHHRAVRARKRHRVRRHRRQGGIMMPMGMRHLRHAEHGGRPFGLGLPTCRALTVCSYILGATYPEIDYAGALPGRYDDPAYEVPGCIICWGKDPLPSNPDGLWGACGGGTHEARDEDHHHRPARDVAFHPRRIRAAPAPRHRCRARHGDGEHHGGGRPLRPRVRGETGPTASSSWQSAARRCPWSAPPRSAPRRGGHHRCDAPVRHRQALVHSLGPSLSTRRRTARRPVRSFAPSWRSPAVWTRRAAPSSAGRTTP